MNLKEYSEDELLAIEENAALFFTPSEIAQIIEKETIQFILDYQENKEGVKTKYNKGYFISQAKVRKGLIELATKGSNTAISDTLKLLNKLQKQLEIYE